MSCASGEGFVQLFESSDFYLDRKPGLLRIPHGLSHAACRGDVVVLDEHGIVQTDAVVDGSACFGCSFFQQPKAGRGLAGIEDLAASAFDGSYELIREGGDPGELLEEVEGHALAFEEFAGIANDGRDAVAVVEAVTVGAKKHKPIGIDVGKNFEAGKDHRFADEEIAGGLAVRGYAHA